MDITKYDLMSNFLKDLRKKLNISQSKLAKQLDISSSYINQIEGNTKNPSDKVLHKLSNLYNLDYEKCVSLREKTAGYIKEKLNNPSSSVKTELEHTTDQIIQKKEMIQELTKEDGPTIKNEFLSKLQNLSDEVQESVFETLNEVLETQLTSMIERHSYRNVKDKIISTWNQWRKLANTPKYEKEENTAFSEELEGFLELSNASLFYSLTMNEKVVKISTRYQDRLYMEKFVELLPGMVITEYTDGNLGKMYKNVPLSNVYIFNMAPTVKDLRISFSNLGLQLQKINFENISLEPYFKKI